MIKQILKIHQCIWLDLVSELKKRGMGERESAAFLLGPQDTNEITQFVCYDDLDPTCLDTGMVIFNGVKISPLWAHCKSKQLSVLADIHTHPGKRVTQSEFDEHHPTISQFGHIAIILPYYATKTKKSLRGIGIYKYLGNHQWETLKNKSLTINN